MSIPTARSFGFSLVEMILTVAVFLLLSAGAIGSYQYFSQRQRILQSAKNVQQLFFEAQKKAHVGERPSGCGTLNGYRVKAIAGTGTVTLYAVCSSNLNPGITVKTVTLLNGITISSNFDIVSKVLSGGFSAAADVSVQRTATDRYLFQVKTGGEITEGDYVSN